MSCHFTSGGQSIGASSISPPNEYPGLISFRINWFDLVVQGTLKSLLQHHSSKASILQYSAFSIVQLSHSLVFPHGSVDKEFACVARDPSSIPGSGKATGEGMGYPLQYSWASLVAQLVKNPPAMQETLVQFLSQEDPLEKG